MDLDYEENNQKEKDAAILWTLARTGQWAMFVAFANRYELEERAEMLGKALVCASMEVKSLRGLNAEDDSSTT